MSKPEAKRMGRFTQMAVVSAKEALDGAGFTLDEAEADRCGVIVSSGIGGIATIQSTCKAGETRGFDKVSPFFIPMAITIGFVCGFRVIWIFTVFAMFPTLEALYVSYPITWGLAACAMGCASS